MVQASASGAVDSEVGGVGLESGGWSWEGGVGEVGVRGVESRGWGGLESA